jgi:hypothetical protein
MPHFGAFLLDSLDGMTGLKVKKLYRKIKKYFFPMVRFSEKPVNPSTRHETITKSKKSAFKGARTQFFVKHFHDGFLTG